MPPLQLLHGQAHVPWGLVVLRAAVLGVRLRGTRRGAAAQGWHGMLCWDGSRRAYNQPCDRTSSSNPPSGDAKRETRPMMGRLPWIFLASLPSSAPNPPLRGARAMSYASDPQGGHPSRAPSLARIAHCACTAPDAARPPVAGPACAADGAIRRIYMDGPRREATHCCADALHVCASCLLRACDLQMGREGTAGPKAHAGREARETALRSSAGDDDIPDIAMFVRPQRCRMRVLRAGPAAWAERGSRAAAEQQQRQQQQQLGPPVPHSSFKLPLRQPRHHARAPCRPRDAGGLPGADPHHLRSHQV